MRDTRQGEIAATSAAVAIIVLAIGLRIARITQGWPGPADSDESTMGLMARRIAYSGEHPLLATAIALAVAQRSGASLSWGYGAAYGGGGLLVRLAIWNNPLVTPFPPPRPWPLHKILIRQRPDPYLFLIPALL